MTHEQAQEYLLKSYGAGRKKGMDAVLAALALLGDPQEKLKIIHVAGTNGKGSFCAMMGSILKEAGYRVGSFTSPHIEVFNERFTVNGKMISNDDFARHLGRIADISRNIYGNDDGFSYFEYLTILAFCYFYEQNIDFVLLEVGIGGRNDCTNVIKSPLLCAIMAIGYDHMEILGNDLESIAREKGGIIKQNSPVALYNDVDTVQDVFREISVEKNAKIYQSKNICLDGMEIGLLGQHQLKNAQVVMTACNALRDLGIILDDTHVRNGLSKARHMGRMEIMSENPTIILEGAHNLQGAEACAQNMRELFADKKITVIMGMMNDKELDKIVNTLALPAENVIFTKPHYDFRATDPQNLMDLLKDTKKQTFVEDNCVDAFELAEKITPKDGLILITGSLYLVGDIRAHLTKGGVSND